VQRNIDVDLDEIPRGDQRARELPIRPVGRDEGRHDDQAGVDHQRSHLGGATDVLRTVSGGKSQVAVQPRSEAISVEEVGVTALGVKARFDESGGVQFDLRGAGRAGAST
jgi:hypothetical protein